MKKLRFGVLFSLLTIMGAGVFAADAPDAKSIVDRYLQAIGGADAYKAMQTVKRVGVLKTQGMEIGFSQWSKRPDKLRQVLALQGQEIVQATDGDNAWVLNPLAGLHEPNPMPDPIKKVFQRRARFDQLFFDNPQKHEITLTYKGLEKDEKGSYHHILATHSDGHEQHMYYNTETGLLAKSRQMGPTHAGEEEITTTYDDWRETDGVKFPYSIETSVGQSIDFTETQVNTTVEDSIFTLPKD